MTNRLSGTNVTRLLLACFVGKSLNIDAFCSCTKRSVQRNVKFCGRFFQTKILSRLSHKVCCRLSSPVLLRKFTIFEPDNGTIGSLKATAISSDGRQPEVDFLHHWAVVWLKLSGKSSL